MYIVMHCLGMPFNGNTISEKSLGGSETAAYYMAKELVKAGHFVTLFTNHPEGGDFEGVKYAFAGQQTDQFPLGANFHFYAENTPHDVCVVQRHPQAFAFKWASKVNLWWLHDLALLRQKSAVDSMLWNVDGVLTVSEFHKSQVCDTWGVLEDIVHVVNNAVDAELFNVEVEKDPGSLIYTSRPERGLEHLVKPGGIMGQLPDKILYVCGYDNTTEQMREYYDYLWRRCDELSNVINLGPLNKKELAKRIKECDALVYPTPGPAQPGFEEVSCIAVMEAMAAGIAVVTTPVGALPETLFSYEELILCDVIDGQPDVGSFVEAIKRTTALSNNHASSYAKYTWAHSCLQLVSAARSKFSNNYTDIIRHAVDYSDIHFVKNFLADPDTPRPVNNIVNSVKNELNECYKFSRDNIFREHYRAYYEYEEKRGAIYGPEDLNHNLRFKHTSHLVNSIPDCRVVGDYGCAHGHYTINLAKLYPDKRFIGYDIEQRNVDKARKWADEEGVNNVAFYRWSVGEENEEDGLNESSALSRHHDVILVCELLEHVNDPLEIINALAPCTDRFLCSTPHGPWERVGYKEHWPWRAHLHHFERADIVDMFGGLDEFSISNVPSGNDKFGNCLGSYVYQFKSPGSTPIKTSVNYSRKEFFCQPRQTLSLCMIVKDASRTLEAALYSCREVVDEVVIGFDETTSDDSKRIATAFCDKERLPLTVLDIQSPLEQGFDEARNEVIKQACGSWVVWLDSDEVLVNPERLPKYLRNNEYNGYAVSQYHLSVDPPGVIKTDLPAKLFRNHRGIKFYGVVHEHPEKGLNDGLGHVFLLPDVFIGHYGYPDDTARQGRFDRNIPLLLKDREKYPDRVLGKFLYIRDLAQMCGHDVKTTGNLGSAAVNDRLEEATKLWGELVDSGNLRLIIDALPYYSTLVRLGGSYYGVAFNVAYSKDAEVSLTQEHEVSGYLRTKDQVDKLLSFVNKEKTKDLTHRYL